MNQELQKQIKPRNKLSLGGTSLFQLMLIALFSFQAAGLNEKKRRRRKLLVAPRARNDDSISSMPKMSIRFGCSMWLESYAAGKKTEFSVQKLCKDLA
jgi:hypothetical protein